MPWDRDHSENQTERTSLCRAPKGLRQTPSPRAGGARGLWAPLVMLRTFPIKLVYTVHDDALLLVAVFHARRRPGYWLERLRQSGR